MSKTIVTSARGKEFRCFVSWSPKQFNNFLQTQWVLLAPAFEGTGKNITIGRQCPLPFRIVERLDFGQPDSYRVAIHKAHFKPVTESETPAIVYEWSRPSEVDTDLQMQVDRLRGFQHPHISAPLISFDKGPDGPYCILFPWAEGRSLEEFWGTDARGPGLSLWAVKQMVGLADGLRVLHEASFCHNCLSPTNIFLFRQPEEAAVRGHLGIAGLPYQRRHIRLGRTTTARHPIKEDPATAYSDPEFLAENWRPQQSSDVWSMGLLFMEFVLWLLHGVQAVQEFRQMYRNLGVFWNGRYLKDAKLREAISSVLLNDLRNTTQCATGTAWRDIVDFLADRVWATAKARSTAKEMHSRLQQIATTAERDVSYIPHPGPGNGQPLKFGAVGTINQIAYRSDDFSAAFWGGKSPS
ncbi:hypothetical protein DL765_004988 [Monosporascus sp. GIB2]|nr:hypothetical protein DL765_004988 [Monosporascus sp. GIB2]